MALRLRISLLSALISGVVLLGFGTASWWLIYRERLAAVDREIRTLAARHPGWLANRGNYERLTSMLAFTFGEQRKDQVVLRIAESDGKVLYQSPHWPKQLALAPVAPHPSDRSSTAEEPLRLPSESSHPGPPWSRGAGPGHGGMGRGYGRGPVTGASFDAPPTFMTIATGDSSWRFGVLTNRQVTVALGLNLAQLHSERNHLGRVFLLVLPLALLVVGAGGWIIGTRALQPLQVIADTAERVTARGLDQRIRLHSSDSEVTRLVQVLNGMMDRLEKSFHQATRFAADASHELKTPLTIMQGELESALRRAAVGSFEQQTFGNLLEEVGRLKHITRNLLLLARADAGQLKLSQESVDLSDLLENALEDARVLAAPQELTCELQTQPQLQVHGDRSLLTTAILNLLSNAIRYNQPRGRIAVSSKSSGPHILIQIGNTGPGIPAADQPRLFSRFFRGTSTAEHRPDGFGLGLSLAREIARAHGGDIVLEESRPGWTSFVLRLPRP